MFSIILTKRHNILFLFHSNLQIYMYITGNNSSDNTMDISVIPETEFVIAENAGDNKFIIKIIL